LPEVLLFLFVYRNGVADGLPDLFAVAGRSCRRRDGLDGVEVAADFGVGFGASVALAQVVDDARGLWGLLVVVLDECSAVRWFMRSP